MTIPALTGIATLAGGCFWCLEAVFLEMRGVIRVVSGYMGGSVVDPTYDQVCAGDSGHAEVVRIEFDPAQITFRDLLEVFFEIHDPTTLNRQGNDVGTQYRSAIFFHSAEQESVAKEFIARDGAIVTELVPADTFWPAEPYHQNYFAGHQKQSYCAFVVAPKVQKFRKHFAEKARG